MFGISDFAGFVRFEFLDRAYLSIWFEKAHTHTSDPSSLRLPTDLSQYAYSPLLERRRAGNSTRDTLTLQAG
jgi:hypothetical protein